MEMQPSLSQPSNNRRQKSTSGDSFSFPSTPNQEESDFEFESLTPDSPSCTTSPADHIFFNGRLQPHSFPLSHCSFQKQHYYPAAVATTSRTSSTGSKDSLLSSRSNSTNSSCSSARTSSSDSSERRLFNNSMVSDRRLRNRPFGCSQRWQYITPVPASNRDASKRRETQQQQLRKSGEKKKQLKKKKKKNTVRGVPLRFGLRIFRWFFAACRQCHAMEPSKSDKEAVTKTQ